MINYYWELAVTNYNSNLKKQKVIIEATSEEERLAYIRERWECMHNCELCGKCHILKGSDAEELYAEYIEGKRSYIEITLDIRK